MNAKMSFKMGVRFGVPVYRVSKLPLNNIHGSTLWHTVIGISLKENSYKRFSEKSMYLCMI